MTKCHSVTEAGYSNCLAYTGLDLWTIVIVAIVVLLVGLALNLLVRRMRTEPEPKPEHWQGL